MMDELKPFIRFMIRVIAVIIVVYFAEIAGRISGDLQSLTWGEIVIIGIILFYRFEEKIFPTSEVNPE